MSELMQGRRIGSDFRWRLLTTVSAAVLAAGVYSAEEAHANGDVDRPTVWLELGAQLEDGGAAQEPISPPFVINNLDRAYNVVSPLDAQRPPRFAFGGEGSISIAPKNSDWVFTAAVRYGRSNGNKRLHQQTSTKIKQHVGVPGTNKYRTFDHTITHFNDMQTAYHEAHTVLDFKAGKDVGLGMLGGHSTSNFGFGIRYAQFSSKSTAVFRSLPDQYYPSNAFNVNLLHHHSYYARADIKRSFRGLGPSISWTGSAPIIGNPDTTEISLDWAANAAALFGRQKVTGAHQTTGIFYTGSYNAKVKSGYHHPVPVNRSHSAIVPNVGGLAGITFRRSNAKVSFGYRADFFFGAMDAGVDARHTENVNFHGPFATISIGLP